MLGWIGDIERETLANETFRTVVFTGEHTQLTLMRLAPGADIGWEAHHDRDQFLRVESGAGGSSWDEARRAPTRRTTSRTTRR